jgi:hypothetical protein
MVVESKPADPSREDAFNKWYSEVHLPDVRAIPGFVAARRYRLHTSGGGEPDADTHTYLAVYEVEADDLTGPAAELRRRGAAGEAKRSSAVGMNPAPLVRFYEFIEEQ